MQTVNQLTEVEILKAKIAQAEAEREQAREALKEAKEKLREVNRIQVVSFTHKKSGKEKTGLNVVVGRKPMFFYASQLQELFAMQGEITEVIEANKAKLSWKE